MSRPSWVGNMNYSEKYNSIWCAPPRTGSRCVTRILSYFGFSSDALERGDTGDYFHSHEFEPDRIPEDVVIISNARNPYGRLYSLYKNFGISTNSFEYFVLNEFVNPTKHVSYLNEPRYIKKPDYIIRIENMKEDILKIPFIGDKLNENQVDYLTQHGKPIEDWEGFYTQEMKDIVYNKWKIHFNFWGYEK
jgi:hypothetical protein